MTIRRRSTKTVEAEPVQEPEFTVVSGKKKRRSVNPAVRVVIADTMVSGGEAVVDFQEAAERKRISEAQAHHEEVKKIEEGFDVPLVSGLKRLGELNANKGVVAGREFWSWDSVRVCTKDACRMAQAGLCQYHGKGHFKCKYQVDYMRYVTRVLVAQNKLLPAVDMLKVGFHLVPLYGQLVMFKLEAAVALPFVMDDKGMPKVHPVFKEIRQIISTISAVWATVDVDPGTKRNIKKEMDPGNFIEVGASYEDACGGEEHGV